MVERERRKSSPNSNVGEEDPLSRREKSKKERESVKGRSGLRPARLLTDDPPELLSPATTTKPFMLYAYVAGLGKSGEGNIDNREKGEGKKRKFCGYSRFYSLGKRRGEREKENGVKRTLLIVVDDSFAPMSTYDFPAVTRTRAKNSYTILTGRDIPFEP